MALNLYNLGYSTGLFPWIAHQNMQNLMEATRIGSPTLNNAGAIRLLFLIGYID